MYSISPRDTPRRKVENNGKKKKANTLATPQIPVKYRSSQKERKTEKKKKKKKRRYTS